jgi:hypothetical protein
MSAAVATPTAGTGPSVPKGLPDDGNIYRTASECVVDLLLDLMRRFKGIDADVDAKVDAYVGKLLNQPTIKSLPGYEAYEPRIPFYFEGGPGEGKTSIVYAAAKWFCDIAGLRLIEEPAADFRFGPKDLYFMTSSLQGQTNAMAIGGLPSKGQMGNGSTLDTSAFMLDLASKQAAVTSSFLGVKVSEKSSMVNGRVTRTFVFDGALDSAHEVAGHVQNDLIQAAETRGTSFGHPTQDPDPTRMYMASMEHEGKVYLRVEVPRPLDAAAVHVSEMLPNRRFAMIKEARFAVVNFDDIANAAPSVRNVLLEIAQKNKYSGVADLGSAVVTLTGNMGFEDGTNTMSTQSDAEITRVRKFRVYDTPQAWAERMRKKYASKSSGDCYMGAFIERFGDDEGIFRPLAGHDRSEKGVPKPNSRALENAVSAMSVYFEMAKQGGFSPLAFKDNIITALHSTAGPDVARRFGPYLEGVLSKAQPIADRLLATGELDEAELQELLGAQIRPEEADFSFRFTSALVSAFVDRVAFSAESRALTAAADNDGFTNLAKESMRRMATGLAFLSPDKLPMAMAQAMTRLGGMDRFATSHKNQITLRETFSAALAAGFREASNDGLFVDAQQAEADFRMACSGTTATNTAPVPGRARAGAR